MPSKKNFPQPTRKKIKSFTYYIKIAIVSLCVVVFLGWIYWLSRQYPINSSKDYLDILSAVGQAFGILILGGLLFEIYITRTDEQKRSTPDIFVTPSFVKLSQLPDNAHFAVMEDDEPKPSSNPQDNYHTYWGVLDPAQRTHFIRLQITNLAKDAEAEAREVRFKIKVTHSAGLDQSKDRAAKEFWCPRHSLIIPAGKSEVTLFVRCGLTLDPKITHVLAEVLDYECENRKKTPFVGSQVDFANRALTKKSYNDFPAL